MSLQLLLFYSRCHSTIDDKLQSYIIAFSLESCRRSASRMTTPVYVLQHNAIANYASIKLISLLVHINVGRRSSHQPIAAQLAHLHWSSGHDFRLSGVKSRQARETRVRFPDGEHILLFFCYRSVMAMGTFFSWSWWKALAQSFASWWAALRYHNLSQPVRAHLYVRELPQCSYDNAQYFTRGTDTCGDSIRVRIQLALG